MGAHIEWTTGIVRAGSSFNEYGDPYDFSATVLMKGDEAWILGATGTFTMQLYYDIKFQLKNKGVSKVHWERLKNGRVKTINISI